MLISFSVQDDLCGKHFTMYERTEQFNIIGLVPEKYGFGLLAAECIKYTVNEVNSNILQNNLVLGLEIHDTCAHNRLNVLTELCAEILLQPRNELPCECKEHRDFHFIGIVESVTSTNSRHLSKLLSFVDIPIVSNIATSISLSNKNLYPNFFRTIPSDGVFVRALVDFILMYNWYYVSILSSSNWYGFDGRHALENIFSKTSICIDMNEVVQEQYDDRKLYSILEKLKNRRLNSLSSNVVIIYALNYIAKRILKAAEKINLQGITWILSDGTDASIWYKDINPNIIGGTFIFGHYGGESPQFQDYFNNLFQNKDKNYLVQQYCSKNNITTEHDFKNAFSSSLPYVGFIRNAVYSLAIALKDYIDSVCGKYNVKTCLLQHTFNKSRFFNRYFRSVSFNGLNNESIVFNKYGDVDLSMFHLNNVQLINKSLSIITVGLWSNKAGLKVNNKIYWTSGSEKPPSSICSETCRPGFYPIVNIGKTCCWICVRCKAGYIKPSHGENRCTKCQDGLTNANNTECILFKLINHTNFPRFTFVSYVLTAIGFMISSFVIFSLIRFRNTPLIKASNFKLSLVQVFAQFVLFFTLNFMLYDGDRVFCVVSFFINGWLITLVISILLVKTEQLVHIFTSKIRITSCDIFVMKAISFAVLTCTTFIEICLTAGMLLLESVHINTVYHTNSNKKELTCNLGNYIIVQSLYEPGFTLF